MINLITGTPGSGKTSYALKFMLDQIKGGSRKLYVHGIPNLKLPHERVYCSSKNCDVCSEYDQDTMHDSLKVENWHLYAPHGAVYFLDECQNIYRPRAGGSKVPDSIQAFEVHRHKGLDFFLITQNPSLIDVNLRALVSRHIHLKPTWAGRFQYEWAECKASVQSTTDAIKSNYRLDKKTFDLYKSASVHTKQDRKTPTILYILILCAILFLFLSFRVYSRINKPDLQQIDAINLDASIQPPAVGLAPASPAAGVDTSMPIKTYSFRDVVKLGGFTPDDVIPDYCDLYSRAYYRCYVPKNYIKGHFFSFCADLVCYVLVPRLSNEVDVEVST